MVAEADGAITLRCGSINLRQQSGFKVQKQKQVEDFIHKNRLDICSLEEANIDENTFSQCDFISSSFSVIVNNAQNKYGTACLVKSDLQVDNLHFDTSGRVIVFDIGEVTIVTVYLPSGTDPAARQGHPT